MTAKEKAEKAQVNKTMRRLIVECPEVAYNGAGSLFHIETSLMPTQDVVNSMLEINREAIVTMLKKGRILFRSKT